MRVEESVSCAQCALCADGDVGCVRGDTSSTTQHVVRTTSVRTCVSSADMFLFSADLRSYLEMEYKSVRQATAAMAMADLIAAAAADRGATPTSLPRRVGQNKCAFVDKKRNQKDKVCRSISIIRTLFWSDHFVLPTNTQPHKTIPTHPTNQPTSQPTQSQPTHQPINQPRQTLATFQTQWREQPM